MDFVGLLVWFGNFKSQLLFSGSAGTIIQRTLSCLQNVDTSRGENPGCTRTGMKSEEMTPVFREKASREMENGLQRMQDASDATLH